MSKSPVAEASAYARRIIEEELEIYGSVELPHVADRMVLNFRNDTDWLDRFLREMFRPICHDIAQRQASRTRKHIVFGDSLIDREEVKEKTRTNAKWQGFLERLEYVGDRHISIGRMNRDDLMVAASLRRQRGTREFEVAALLETLASKLKSPEARVEEVWTNDEVKILIDRMAVSVFMQTTVDPEELASAAD